LFRPAQGGLTGWVGAEEECPPATGAGHPGQDEVTPAHALDALPPRKSQCHLCIRSGQCAIQFRVIELACHDNQAIG
jgi:hypothetical protein